MAYVLTMFLFIATSVTGCFWIYYCIKNIYHYFFIKNIHQNYSSTKKIYIKQNTNKFFQYVSSFFPIFFITFTIRSFFYEPFQIPSGSMMPTLLVGDFILVEKFSYGFKNPITHATWIRTNLPKRGDVVVFKHPIDYNIDYIKRVIGLPGDKIEYDIHTKHIKICQNYLMTNNCSNKVVIEYSEPHPSGFTQKIFLNSNKNMTREKEIYNIFNYDLVEEHIDFVQHKILFLNGIQNLKNDYYKQKDAKTLQWIVPKGQYFMMGDNRDNSLDSRYWGFVPEKNLVGKAIKIWFSVNKNENEWPTGIRINRIGTIH